ncbi:MAG: sporulation integral membrane protein YtvI [Clostridiales bacterium]|nr:sporulation integral membrane protein YtvI [Clostridiales bacterium]
MEKKPIEKLVRPLLVLIYVFLGAAAFHVFTKYLFMWFLPFVIGFAVSRMALPLSRAMEKKLKFKNGLASAAASVIMMIAVIAAVGALGYVLALWIIPYVKRVFTTLSGTMEQLTSTWASLIVALDAIFPADVSKSIQDALSSLPKNFDFMGKVVSPVLSAAGSLPMTIFSVVVTPLSAFFFTKYNAGITGILKSSLPEKIYEAVSRVYHNLLSKLGKWLKAQCILCGIDFVVIFAGLLITGVNNAFTASCLIFVVDFMPVLGSGLVLIPWAIIALLMGNYRVALGVAIVYVVVLVVRNMLEPHVLAAQINMNPFVTLLSIYAGYRLYGVVGMVMLPLLAITVVQLNDWGYIRLWRSPEPAAEAESPPPKSRLKVSVLNFEKPGKEKSSGSGGKRGENGSGLENETKDEKIPEDTEKQ